MDEQELRALIRQYATTVRINQGEAVLTAVLKKVITENPSLKAEVRSSIKLVREEVDKANAMGDDEIEALAKEEGVSLADESTEYEMLEEMVVKRLKEDDILKDHLKALIIYGSYAKRLHVVGESDINFVVVLNADSGEEIVKRVNDIAAEIVTPETAHIFDLMLLKTEDIGQSKFGSVWTSIHELYAQVGEVKLGSNVFANITITDQQIKDSSKEILRDTIVQMDDIITTAQEEGLPKGELDYLIGSSVINIVFALACYKIGTKAVELDLVKPDIHESIQEILSDEVSLFKPYFNLFEQAHAFKLGIKLENSVNFVDNSIKFIESVVLPLLNEKQ